MGKWAKKKRPRLAIALALDLALALALGYVSMDWVFSGRWAPVANSRSVVLSWF